MKQQEKKFLQTGRGRVFKNEARVMGIDDASFDKFRDNTVLVIGVVFRGGQWMDGVVSTTVTVDGTDATEKLISLVNKTRFRPQLQAIFLDGIAVGGFNVIDIRRLHAMTGIPVIAVVRRYPDFQRIFAALEKLGMGTKKNLIEKAGHPEKIGNIWVQYAGINRERLTHLLAFCCTRADVPEAIRAAHLIGQGLAKGESRGRA